MKQLFTVIFLLVSQLILAQGVPALETDSNIRHGKLANGVEYYLVKNTVQKGYADMAIVQKKRFEREKLAEAFRYLPHFGDRKPHEYLSERGIGYNTTGYVTYSPLGTTIRFSDVPSNTPVVTDSLLLMGWDFVNDYPSEQAVILCGDIDPDKVLERIKVMSMTVSPRTVLEKEEVPFKRTEKISFSCKQTEPSALGTFEAVFFSKRMSKSDLQTIEPLVSRMLAVQMGDVIKHRLKIAFEEEQIPVSDISFFHIGSTEQVEEEKYIVRVQTYRDNLKQVGNVVAQVLAELDADGVTDSEFRATKGAQLCKFKERSFNHDISNSQYVSTCIAMYLLDIHPFKETSVNDFLSARTMLPKEENSLLNEYVSAVLSPQTNVALRYESDEDFLDRDSLVVPFVNAWKEGMEMKRSWDRPIDDVKMSHVPTRKVKVKLEEQEIVSGGKMWTFANGMKVIYKQTSTNGYFHYGAFIRGGFASIPGIRRGESAYLNDLIGMYDIGGVSYDDFVANLNDRGVSLRTEIKYNNLQMEGFAPNKQFSTVISALLTMSQSRSFNYARYEAFCLNEYLNIFARGESPVGVRNLLDECTSPGYIFTNRKMVQSLSDDLPKKMDQYLDRQFSSWSNGAIVILGNMDEATVKDYFSKCLSGFETGESIAVRPLVDKNLASGITTVSRDSLTTFGKGGEGLSMAFTAVIPYSINRMAAFNLAATVLNSRIVKAVAPLGMYVLSDTDAAVLPRETMTYYLTCRHPLLHGLPKDVTPCSAEEVSEAVLSVLDDLCENPVRNDYLQIIKARYLQDQQRLLSKPENIVNAVICRYSLGKDVVSGTKESIDAVTAERLQEVFCALRDGTIVQYISK